jgi:hypothetical protein
MHLHTCLEDATYVLESTITLQSEGVAIVEDQDIVAVINCYFKLECSTRRVRQLT